jgi:hypothetical protein
MPYLLPKAADAKLRRPRNWRAGWRAGGHGLPVQAT